MRILFVSLPNNMHSVRHMRMLTKQGWDVHVFPSYSTAIHPEMRDVTVYYLSSVARKLPQRHVRIRSLLPFPKGDFWLEKIFNARWPGWRLKWLVRIIHEIQPDIIHSQTMFGAGYLTLDAKYEFERVYPKSQFPGFNGDAELQMRAIRDHLMSLRGGPSPKVPPPTRTAN